MAGKKKKKAVDVENVTLDEPTVTIKNDPAKPDGVTVPLKSIEYRDKKLRLASISMRLSGAPVAYAGAVRLRIRQCIDYFYNVDPEMEDSVVKAIAAANASNRACALLTDQKMNVFVCALNYTVWLEKIRMPEACSGRYGGLTYLETRGQQNVGNLKIKFLITSEGIILVPVASPEDFVPENAYYYVLREKGRYTRRLTTFLVFAAKSGELERYVTGIYHEDGR